MMKVRRADLTDLESIVFFNAAMAQETEGKTLDAAKLRAGSKAVLQRKDLGFYLVAEADRRTVGQVLITTEWSDWRNASFWWVQSVYVLPEYRRRGVYRALHEKVRSEAVDLGNVCGVRLYVDRKNWVAQEVYQRLGMSHSHYDMYEVEFE
jgi:GNAT superfamily N-acetyltransferase